jgi:uncharacterized protein
MHTLESRAWLADLEIRSSSDGRTIVGLAAPFDQPTAISDYSGRYTETIAPGSFSRSIRERGDRVRLLVQHNSDRLPIGRATSLTEDARGLVAELRVSKTVAGDEALQLVQDGVVDGLSIGFRAVRETWARDRSTRRLDEIALLEISLVAEAAYSEAKVLAVRAATQPLLDHAIRQLQLLSRRNTP